jgi:hypothetical protein
MHKGTGGRELVDPFSIGRKLREATAARGVQKVPHAVRFFR